MTKRTAGTFEVSMKLQSPPEETAGVSLGRMLLEQHFVGDLVATSQGEMLTAITGIKGSAGSVAIDRVEGALHGKKGSLVFQHSGIMDRGKPLLSVTVVPDSGSEQLTGITGRMAIDIVDGKHFYEFEYSLP